VGDRPYTVLSASMSLDGYLDDGSDEQLILSNQADLDRVDALRATCDAILVGAATVRRDNPRLLVRDAARLATRPGLGRTRGPTKVTVTARGDLDPCSAFFCAGDTDKLIYCWTCAVGRTRNRLRSLACVVDAGETVRMQWVSEDLHRRGVRRLLVEGGATVHTQFLTDGLADELQLVVAPFFVGDSCGRRFVDDGQFPFDVHRRARLVELTRIDDVVLLRYALSDRFGAA
jgi:5-amino-6-(5-phosphoribosylamino)uracil reductase